MTRASRTVLLVEDSESLAADLSSYLRRRGTIATVAHTVVEARDLLARLTFDLVLLDLNLGDEDGLDIARDLMRRGGPPIIIITSRIDEADRVLGLELGADDYVTKPFSYRELSARIAAVLRRTTRPVLPERRIATFNGWSADLTGRTVRHVIGGEQALTGAEMHLLSVFLQHPDRVLSRQELLSLMERSDTEVFERTIDVLVGRVRRKLALPDSVDVIRTVHGKGYALAAQVRWSTRE